MYAGVFSSTFMLSPHGRSTRQTLLNLSQPILYFRCLRLIVNHGPEAVAESVPYEAIKVRL